MILPLSGGKPYAWLGTAFNEGFGVFSPGDGRWIAYQSDESGRAEIYVQGFTPGQPASGERVPVSGGGGQQPMWRRDGRELYYLSPEGKLMAVEVKTQGSAFQSGQPSVLFSFTIEARYYDVSADGRRFLLLEPVEAQTEGQPLTLVINWQEGLKK